MKFYTGEMGSDKSQFGSTDQGSTTTPLTELRWGSRVYLTQELHPIATPVGAL
jgi:hypothetical protein